jgi:hypothetical protein
MRRNRRLTPSAPPPDPFGEQRRAPMRVCLQLLGGRFEFETDSHRLLRLVHTAYAQLPVHRFGRRAPRFRMRLTVTPAPERYGARAALEPPLMRPLAATGILCGAVGNASFVALTPRQRSALLVVPVDMLRYAYHVRYELLEFAVYLLAARVQRLVPLHAACLGRGDRGLLLVGPSGSGKSTLVLHGLLAGLDFLAEDSVLVRPRGLQATGIASFVHVRPDSLRFLAPAQRAAVIRQATPIRRRSGVEKLEVDLRRLRCRLARTPQRLRAVIFLSRRQARGGPLLAPLGKTALLSRLAASQRYAARQAGWRDFRERLARLPGFELRRGNHPREAIEALCRLLVSS